MAIQPISTAFGDPQRHDFSLSDRGRHPRDAPKSAESVGTGVAPKDGRLPTLWARWGLIQAQRMACVLRGINICQNIPKIRAV